MASGRDVEAREAEALVELRTRLADDFPEFDITAARRILRRHGLSAPPAGMLLDRLPANGDGKDLRHTGDHPLFSPGYYVVANPDIAATGVPAWLHYQVFGRLEGRAPHPFVQIARLRDAMPDALPGDELDSYLADRSAWFIEPGPYTDAVRFALSGMWTRAESPLAEIVRSHPSEPWVHQRLMLTDLAGDLAMARLAAFASVLGAAPVGVRWPTVTAWSGPGLHRDETTDRPGPYVVVPGFFVGASGVRLWLNPQLAVSPDRTAVATRNEVVTVTAGPRVVGSALVVVTSHAGRADLAAAVHDAAPRTVFAPASRAGELSLRQVSHEQDRADLQVLSFGSQATVVADRVDLSWPAAPPVAPVAPADLVEDAAQTVIVLGLEQRARSQTDSRIGRALAAGAALCVIDGHGLDGWLPVIQNRARVVVTSSLADEVAAVVDAGRILALDGPDR